MPDPQLWGNVAQWVSAVGTVGGLSATAWALWKRHYDSRAFEFDRDYKKHRPHLETFWTILRHEWAAFQNPQSDVRTGLLDFIRQVGPPPLSENLRNWKHEQEASLSPFQRKMRDFASRIFAKPESGQPVTARVSTVGQYQASDFHDARGELAWFWNTEARAILMSHLRTQYWSHRELLLALSWLEVALAQATEADGPGKQQLFRLAKRADNRWRRVWL
jgi:hypothetical protein